MSKSKAERMEDIYNELAPDWRGIPTKGKKENEMTVLELIESLQGVAPETEIVITHDDRNYNIQGVYHEEGGLVELEIGVWRND